MVSRQFAATEYVSLIGAKEMTVPSTILVSVPVTFQYRQARIVRRIVELQLTQRH